ncbi:LCP family protein [Streptomyces rapamycinicus]|uniref:Transcriptional regulator n=2 Tax=Streptomyces rapamycinicus TaxID=1226757 RepID=A0A3L8RIL9_STRRN|nr:LCP family protein [Streptomyces rapamycinicus]MBB4784982.1 LCP family protein required for cell wall assembly [Streptomyces rapamycinicus]RLV79541.1 transcriptional regulator [Streptomyces rapamycinicus NRRL 5491]UTO65219.1 LCP family protein [Streptomyces rapamycinicus]UTP33175.1 LCP family protein [Streptomyces rapamycinicus NRRL 5491]
MRQSSVRGERGRRATVPEPREQGEDDSPPKGEGPAPHGAGHRRGGQGRPKRSRGVRILRWTALTLAVLVLGAAGAGYFYYEHLNGNLKKEDLDLGDSKIGKPEPNAAGQTPLNILLIGSDSRNTAENVKLGGAKQDADRKPLGDVQMLVHVSADRGNMSVVSIPRDTRVTIPRCTDPHDGTVYPKTEGAINQSLQHGGPGCTVATWKELTGVYIDHFMMIDFSGVVSMADAIGGVPVCVDNNVYSHDSKGHGSGLKLTKGTHNVKGIQALQWLRTRYGFEDNSDIGRAKAQHMYMTSMIRQLKSGTKLSDPGKLMDLAEAATDALTVDHGLGTVKKLYDLGNDLKRVPTKRTTMITMPWEYGGGGEYVLPKPGDAEQTFSLLRNDISLDGKDKKKPDATPAPTAPKEQLPVVVQNGTASTVLGPVSGRAAVITSELARLGYAKATANTVLISQADTTVLYPDEPRQGDALAVAKALKLPKSAVKSSKSVREVTLVVGNDWREGTAYPKTAADDGDKTPKSADALNGEEKGCMKVNPGYTF